MFLHFFLLCGIPGQDSENNVVAIVLRDFSRTCKGLLLSSEFKSVLLQNPCLVLFLAKLLMCSLVGEQILLSAVYTCGLRKGAELNLRQ